MAGFRRITIAAIALLVACSAAPDDVDDPGRTVLPDGGVRVPAVEIGTGRDRFVALAENDSVDVIHGPQGGWHIWGALRTTALDNRDARVTYRVSVPGEPETVVSETPFILTLSRNGSRYEWLGLIGLLKTDPPAEPVHLYGKPLTLTMTVVDRAGNTATDSRTVIPKAPP